MPFGTMGSRFGRMGSRAGGSSPALPLLPLNFRLGGIGHSLVANGVVYVNGTWTIDQANGLHGWANAFSMGLARIPNGAIKGVVGEQSADTAARFSTALSPLALDAAVLISGRNDNTSTPNATIANLDSCISQAWAIGLKRLFVVPVTPWTGASGTDLSFCTAIRAALTARAAADKRIVLLDDTGIVPATDTADGTHWLPSAALKVGADAGAKIIANTTPGDILFRTDDPLNLTYNGRLTGSGGSLGGTATGQVASDATLSDTEAGGATVVGSLESYPAGGAGAQKQVITISGAKTGDNKRVEFDLGFDDITGKLAIGDKWECFFQVEASGLTNIVGISALSQVLDTSFAPQALAMFVAGIGVNLPSTGFGPIVMRSETFEIGGSNSPFLGGTVIRVELLNGAVSVAGVVKISLVGSRKV